jgi:large subunit ribosomal protein L21
MIDETRQSAPDAPESAAPNASGAASEDRTAAASEGASGSPGEARRPLTTPSDPGPAPTITLPPRPNPTAAPAGEMGVAAPRRSLPPPPPSRTGRTTPPPPVRGAAGTSGAPRLPLPPPRFASASHPPVSAAAETLASPLDRSSQNPVSIAPATVSSPTSAALPADDATRIRQLQALLGQSKQALTSKENELRAAIAQRDLLRTQVAGREARIRELEKASAREIELRQRTSDLERQLAEQTRKLEEREHQLSQLERALDERDRRIEDRDRRLEEHGQKLQDRDHKLEELGREMEERDRQLAAAEAARTRLARLEPAASEATALRSRVAELDARAVELEAAAAEVLTLKARVAELEAAPPARSEAADDLRQIRGIGPAYARSLNALGIHSFAQVAAWTDADVTAIAEALKTRPDRIRRDGWIARAKELLQNRSR